MLLFKRLLGGRYSIIEDGRVYLFDKTGKIEAENLPLTTEYTNSAVQVDYISILYARKRVEVAIFKRGTLTRYESSLSAQDCVMVAFYKLKFICFLRRDGKFNNIGYNQAIMVMTDISDLPYIEEVLKLTKV